MKAVLKFSLFIILAGCAPHSPAQKHQLHQGSMFTLSGFYVPYGLYDITSNSSIDNTDSGLKDSVRINMTNIDSNVVRLSFVENTIERTYSFVNSYNDTLALKVRTVNPDAIIEYSINGNVVRNGDVFSREDIETGKYLYCRLNNLDLNLQFNVIEFQIRYLVGDNLIVEKVEGNQVPLAVLKELSRLKSSTAVEFSSIVVKDHRQNYLQAEPLYFWLKI